VRVGIGYLGQPVGVQVFLIAQSVRGAYVGTIAFTVDTRVRCTIVALSRHVSPTVSKAISRTHVVEAKRDDLLPLLSPSSLIPHNQSPTRSVHLDGVPAIRIRFEISESRIGVESLSVYRGSASDVVCRLLCFKAGGVEGKKCA